jgi:hypothetical protein
MGGRPAARPQFLRICWEIANEEGGEVVEATLCRDHRREIARKYPDARGSANSVTRVTPAQAGSRGGSQVASIGTASEESHTRERHRPTARPSSASA